jgi:trehalose synthase
MADGTGGILVDRVEECARAMVSLIRDPARARALGESGRARVRRNFLIPRLVLDELALMRRMAAGVTRGRAFEWVSHRDPVCGMAVELTEESLTLKGGLTLQFCSAQCRETFEGDSNRYLGSRGMTPQAADADTGLESLH